MLHAILTECPMLNMGCLPSITQGFSQFLAAPTVAEQVTKGIETELREGKIEPTIATLHFATKSPLLRPCRSSLRLMICSRRGIYWRM